MNDQKKAIQQADLPISALPLATVAPPASPMAAVVSGTTSQISITTLLTAFTAQATKPSPDPTDEMMLYDGTLLKSDINSILTTFTNNSVKTNVDTSDEVMIYDGSLLKTTVNDILEAFTENTNIASPNVTDELMIYDSGLFKTTVNGILSAFTQNPLKSPLSLSDEIMMYDTVIQKTTVDDILTTFIMNSNKPVLAGDEEVMIYDPTASQLLKTTISAIIGSIISPLHYVYYGVETGSQDGTYRVRAVGASAAFDFTFAFPTDMTAIQELYLLAFPEGGVNPGAQIVYTSSYGNIDNGESRAQVTGGFTGTYPTLPDDVLVKIDISAAFDGSGGASRAAEAGDMAGLMVSHQGIGGSINYLMLQMIYEGPGGSGSTILVIDNLNSTSTVDALSANQGRILNEIKQDISTLQTDIQALNFTDLTVLNAPVAGTDVVNKTYADNLVGVVVIDNLTSTSAIDALSANQGRVLNEIKQDISTLQTAIEALNFTDLTVLNAPINNTDVANKQYVDDNSSNITVIDNLTSTSATDALSANQGRVLNEIKQNISTLQVDIQAIPFINLTVTTVPANPTDVANKAYVDSSSGGITVIDNLTSTSPTDALSANQGRVLNEAKQDISTLQSDIQLLNFTGLTVVGAPVSNTDVANKAYVDSSSGGITVIDNLTSTSATDALSANQGRVLNEAKQEISTLQTDIQALNFTDLTVLNAPVANTDVANKAYVDASGGITVIDNLTSTSATDALSANQGRVLNENKQEISTLQTDIEALNFTELTVTTVPADPTDVANKNYVDTSFQGTVIDNLNSTSATDALSANQGNVLDTIKLSVVDLVTEVENASFTKITVTDPPNATDDVTNKLYVDDGLALKQDIATLQTAVEAINFDFLIVTPIPTNNNHVANKAYVDNQIGALVFENWLPVPNPMDLASGPVPFTLMPAFRLSSSNPQLEIGYHNNAEFGAAYQIDLVYMRPAGTPQGATIVGTVNIRAGTFGGTMSNKTGILNNVNWDTSNVPNGPVALDLLPTFNTMFPDPPAAQDFVSFIINWVSGDPIDICGIIYNYDD